MTWPGIDHWIGGPHETELVPMSWEELATLAAAGWEVGAHTRTHPHMTQLRRRHAGRGASGFAPRLRSQSGTAVPIVRLSVLGRGRTGRQGDRRGGLHGRRHPPGEHASGLAAALSAGRDLLRGWLAALPAEDLAPDDAAARGARLARSPRGLEGARGCARPSRAGRAGLRRRAPPSMPAERRGPRDPRSAKRPRARGLFERFPEGLVLVGEGRRVVSMNRRAQALLGLDTPPENVGSLTCCELVCNAVDRRGRSFRTLPHGADASHRRAARRRSGDRSLEGSGRRARGDHSRGSTRRTSACSCRSNPPRTRGPLPATGLAATARPELRVHTLGRIAVEAAGREIGGEWVEQRPGLLLKYLVCERHRVAASDRIAEALWPEAQRREALASLRHYVHVLRERLEPDRAERGASSFVETHRGGYRLDPERVWVDATELERRAGRGLELHAEGQPDLRQAVSGERRASSPGRVPPRRGRGGMDARGARTPPWPGRPRLRGARGRRAGGGRPRLGGASMPGGWPTSSRWTSTSSGS